MSSNLLPALLGSMGVGLLLTAFFLNLNDWLHSDRLPYLFANLVGAALAAWSSWAIGFLPFLVLEGTWTGVAAVGIVRRLGRRSTG